ncbi:serine/threonine-protein kinase [Streptomyces sp. NBC_01304]|uniref:serine/threonine-protein kinase n=1 Tax=Streptomyces sp. NBC_01304 TaxID=2903818 RepID=UPI002E127856|nr:protein kinase [Streptomyces sp. NBC_01304]
MSEAEQPKEARRDEAELPKESGRDAAEAPEESGADAAEESGRGTAVTPKEPAEGKADVPEDAPDASLDTSPDASPEDSHEESSEGSRDDDKAPVEDRAEKTSVEDSADKASVEDKVEVPKKPVRGAASRLLAGRYRLGEVLGRGGMGTVWRAVDETLGRTVAVKELRFPSAIDDDEKRRLITRTLREAKAIARIRNNGAVTVYDVVDEDDRPWIVMELIEGKSLAEVVREDGYLTPKRAAEVGLAVLDVLRSAHREGILHRDVKPSNVLIAGDDGRVVLTDFGIAQVEGDPSITSTGMLVGAPSYISPERARGHKPGPAADLWSLGGLLYAAVEGVPPYDKGSAIATLTAVMTEQLEPPRNAGRLEKVIYGLLEKDPEHRLDDASARALLNDVVNAPEPLDAEPGVVASPEQTKVVPLPPVPADSARRGEVADRLRGALRSVRNAASSTGPAEATASESTAAAGGSDSGAGSGSGGAGRPARASLSDVVPRRTLVLVAVAVAIAVLGAVLAVALNGNEDQPDSKGGGKDKAASSGANTGDGGDQGKDEPSQGTDPTGDSQEENGGQGSGGDEGDDGGSGDGDDGGQGSGDQIPEGYERVADGQFRFSMAMPKEFRRTGTAGRSSGAIFSEDGGFPRVQVDFNRNPSDSAASAWRSAVPAVSGSSTNFKMIGIRTVEYNGYPTVADWEFERDQNGDRIRVLNRGFKVDENRGYAIMISCKASEWDSKECTTLRKTAFATFRPE